MSGFESTLIFGSGKDILDLTEHTERVEEDLALARCLGIKTLRYSIPWHKVERSRGAYDWGWVDRALAAARGLELELVVDLLHHTSFPEWLTGGFLDRRFVPSFVQFVVSFADLYPWISKFTYINEPLVTAWFCAHEGLWAPYACGDANFVAAVLNLAEAICRLDYGLRADRKIEFWHVDVCERHFGDPEIAELGNQRRFLVTDLISGRIIDGHPLHAWLREHGMTQWREDWFARAPARINVLGLDYYLHCELWWELGRRIDPPYRWGFAQLAREYAIRYPLAKLALTETNIRGTPLQRIEHFNMMQRECRKLNEMTTGRFTAFCWYPLVDSCDWDSLVLRADGHLDPQGIISLTEERARIRTPFSDAFARAASKG